MRICKYQGRTMAEALNKVRRALGDEAVIIRTRTLKRHGVLGIGAGQIVEITASRDLAPLAKAARQATEAPLRPKLQTAYSADEISSLHRDVTSIKSVLLDLLRETRHGRISDLPEPIYNLYQRLIDSGVPKDVAQAVAERFLSQPNASASSWEDAKVAVNSYLAVLIPTSGPIQLAQEHLRTVALVGPTGVGKTTTIAKIAANYKLQHGAKVALATIDTYRIAAVEQLRTIASIMDVPLDVVASPAQLRGVIEAHRDKDLLLIDTAGRSQRNRVRIGELKTFFDANPIDEVHLVLSVNAAPSHLADVCRRFSVLSPTHILLTKLDEAIAFGSLIDVARKAERPISYVTDGQDIPEDIRLANSSELAAMILSGPEDQKLGDESV